MGEKRQYGDYAEHPDRAAKRQKESSNNSYNSYNSDKPRHLQPGVKKHARRPESSNWAKKRARTIERRLRNPDSLPANVQRDLESELAALRRQIEERQSKRVRAHMISKYHMLRFFERKKAIRRQKQLKKQHNATDDAAEKAELAQDLAVAEIDVLYPQYYPFLEPYVSLYPQSKKGTDDKDDKDGKSTAPFSRSPRPPMWEEIKAAYEAGGLQALQNIRDRQPPKEGKQSKDAKGSKGSKASKADKAGAEKKPGNTAKSKESKKVEVESDSDDGGFFEED
ncbi:rRNA-processing protein efg-1 [Sporothrix brasiliensis 5110]|uniref:rRNA-processing protein EFG1 n=1 Tax=Sporothrix brasiliensis 5110 TaxID=1398154 RepID=A0A0C2FHZ8_9PEZI|nr:rRNA-processing protein efg-1 [Sporothrix brasiliensis 5110]KIH90633.1 rRNA-processing protein efg-1 [Sporothrix brasiliensis 5110]